MDENSIEAGLLAALYRKQCPAPQQLGDYHLGYLSAAEQTAVQAHLKRCPHCRAELAELVEFLAEDTNAPAPSQTKWTQARGFQWRWGEAGQVIIHLLTASAAALSPVPVKGHTVPDKNVIRRLTLDADQTGDLEVEAVLRQYQADEATGTLTVRVDIPSRWPDLAGVPVSATAGSWQAAGHTDESGAVTLTGLPLNLIDDLEIAVNPPP